MAEDNIFSFLRDEFEYIYNSCGNMELCILNGLFNSAIIEGRRIAESLSKKICVYKKQKSFLDFDQKKRLREMKYFGLIDSETKMDYDTIRRTGNKVVHNDVDYSLDKAKLVHKLIYNITTSFYEDFGKKHLFDISKYSFDIESNFNLDKERLNTPFNVPGNSNEVENNIDLDDSFSNDSDFKLSLVNLFEKLNYSYFYGPDIVRDYSIPFYEDQLRNSLLKINKDLTPSNVDFVINKLKDNNSGSLEENNFIFMNYLQNGLTIHYMDDQIERTSFVKLVDFNNIENNTFQICREWTVNDLKERTCEFVIFINGLPLVVVELNSLNREEGRGSKAYGNLKVGMEDIPSLFTYNAFCVLTDFITSKAGTITSNEDYFMKWKSIDGEYNTNSYIGFNVLFEGMFNKNHLLDIIENFILFSNDANKYTKILSAYHQYFAVNKALDTTRVAINGDGKAGVFWHTQGSGKSLSMVFYVNKLQKYLESPTFVVVTDRNDLDNQLFTQFEKCKDFIRQSPVNATSRENLKELLNNRKVNGIFFTTIQKFDDTVESLTERKDVIVIADEAHRSQYGLDEKIDEVTGVKITGSARRIRNNLPNATFIGFTGTPLKSKDKSTKEVFGDYIDIYDMTQSVEDGATCKIQYEDRVVKIDLDTDSLEDIDKKYEELSQTSDAEAIEKSKRQLSKMEELLGAPETINSLCNDLIKHYSDNRMYELEGKAMIVAYSRSIAMKIYEKILQIKPEWKEKIKVVMTGRNNDPKNWSEITGTTAYRQELANKFKNPKDELKIVIVVDMWLTGFDVPSLDTMYIYKPMKDHNLMQAIARVNRVYEGKSGGLIVDYIGIKEELKKAMDDYTKRDKENFKDINITNSSYPKFKEILGICKAFLMGVDYTDFSSNNPKIRSKLIKAGVNFLLKPENEAFKEEFMLQSSRLKRELALCRSETTENEKLYATYFESVRKYLTSIQTTEELEFTRVNNEISTLIKHSIKSEGVISLFPDSENKTVDLEDLLSDIGEIDEKDLAVNIISKKINDEIKLNTYKKNITKSKKFSEMLKKSMNEYMEKRVPIDETLQKLIDLADKMVEDINSGEKLGLTQEELAFYDAIIESKNIKNLYENDKLIKIVQELTYEINKNKTIDWNKKESSYAGMRRSIKRLLMKYNYPREELNDTVNAILKQSELSDADTII